MSGDLPERRVAIFGGSFNPPHVAHALAVVYALSVAPIDEVLVVPVFRHPFSKELAPFEDRVRMCELAAERIRGQTVEQSVEIRRLQGSSGVGFYFVATDQAPQPQEFRFMNQGALQVGDLTVMFTILTNEGQEAVVEEAFAMLRSAVYRDIGGDQQ